MLLDNGPLREEVSAADAAAASALIVCSSHSARWSSARATSCPEPSSPTAIRAAVAARFPQARNDLAPERARAAGDQNG